ncbi:TPR domain-containing glycosyltransferase [Desulfosporosinus metallidurans]|uniref:Glycosyltransferase fused to TPR-repeat domain n=1 Tax=Desulfosporosinus metallidurans TaxID=1888891 RepID=A0A1Q8QYA0_9FIRM|nr:TPR domain-containing glycosyltransferase [Desulfosporosinus metallidurans]OLN32332.1 Glycosyltransferase fused to TPR-repeat domain [Desulfosporosinus metallidurans]
MAEKISLCMIVKNEGQDLRRCLNSVQNIVHEIIVVDTGSTDSTSDIARQYGAILHHFLWNDNFSDARNASLELAQGDWILFLDADEELSPDSREILIRLIENETIEGYFVKIMNHLGKEGWIETVPDLVFRLFRNKKEYRFRGAIHEQIADVILEKNSEARFQVAEDLMIIHHGYLDNVIKEKDKKHRNLSLIEKELELKPNNRLLQFHYGVELFRAERYTEAAAVLIQSATDIDPNTIYLPKLLRYIVIAQQSSGQLNEALNSAALGLRLFPDYADLYYYTGLILLDLKHYSQARNAFLQALSMPEQPPQYASFGGVRGFRAYYYLAQIAESFLDEEEALKYYLYSLRDNARFTHALERLVGILKPTKEPDYTKECLEKVCDFCTPEANRLMGDIYYQHGAYGLALYYFDQAEDESPVLPDIKLKKAICLIQELRFFEALRLLTDFTQESPNYPLATLNRLFCFWIQNNPQKVRTLWKELHALGLAQDTDNVISLFLAYDAKHAPSPQMVLGSEGIFLLLDIIQRLVALQEIERAMYFLHALQPKCLIKYNLKIAQIFVNYSEENRAIPFLQTVIENDPLAEAHFQLAEIHSHLGRFSEAEQHYKHALHLDPDTPRSYVRLINLYTAWRQSILKEALAKYPENDVFKKLAEEGASNHERTD